MIPSLVRLPRRYLKALLLRGTFIWVLSRAMALVIWAYSLSMGGPELAASLSSSGPILAPWVVLIGPALVLIDLIRRRERMLLQNLGVTTVNAVAAGASPTIALEVLILSVQL